MLNTKIGHPLNIKIILSIVGIIGLLGIFFLVSQAMNRPTEIRSKAAGIQNQPLNIRGGTLQPTPRPQPTEKGATECLDKCEKKYNSCYNGCGLKKSKCETDSYYKYNNVCIIKCKGPTDNTCYFNCSNSLDTDLRACATTETNCITSTCEPQRTSCQKACNI